MAKIHTLVDAFNATNNTQWSYDGATVGSGVVTITQSAASSQAAMLGQVEYDLTNSSIMWNVPSFSASGTGSNLESGLRDYSNGANVKFTTTYDGDVYGITTSAGGGLVRGGNTWQRIRHSASAGLIYFDTSLDGITWTNRTSATPASLGVGDLARMKFEALINNNSGSTTVTLDDINIAQSTNRYVVATGTWDSENTTLWSYTSSGVNGAIPPADADTVYLSANNTLTLGTNPTINSFIQTNGTLTFGNYKLICDSDFQSTGSTTRTINMNSGVLETGRTRYIQALLFSGTNLTFNAHTSLVILHGGVSSSPTQGFATNYRVFNDVLIKMGMGSESNSMNIIDGITCRNITIRTYNSQAHTIYFNSPVEMDSSFGAAVTAENFVAIGASTTNRLTLSAGATTGSVYGYRLFRITGSTYGQNLSLVDSTGEGWSAIGGLSSPAYFGSNSIKSSTVSNALLQDPPKANTLVDPMLLAPSINTNWNTFILYSGYTAPDVSSAGIANGGYSFASAQSLLSFNTYDFIDNDIIIEFPASNPYGDFEVVIGNFTIGGAPTSGAYWHSMGQNGIVNAIGIWKSNLLNALVTRMAFTPEGSTSTFGGTVSSVTPVTTGRQFVKLNISSTDGKLRSTIHDGTSWGSTTTSSLVFDEAALLTFKSARIMLAEHPNLSSTNPVLVGSINVMSENVSPLYYVDGHNGVSDPQSVWTNDADAFDSIDTTSAYTTGNGGSVSTKYLQGQGTNAPTSGSAIIEVYGRAKYELPDGAAGENIHIYTSTALINDSGNLAGVAGTTGSTGVYSGGWSRLVVPTGGWDWSKVNGLVARAWATDNTSNLFKLRIVEINVISQPTETSNTGAFFAFFYP